MKASKKRGFTIIELVIVIAVIAILAAVLIPTFTNVIQKAKEANDTIMVKRINEALSTDAILRGEKHSTMTEALQSALDRGYDLTKIRSTAGNNKILWDSVSDCFVYLKDGEITYIPDSMDSSVNKANKWIYFNIVDGITDEEQANGYSMYLDGEFVSGDITIQSGLGFDAGKNAKIASVTYDGTSDHDVVIRTDGGNLTVTTGTGAVNHYGNATKITVDGNYNEFGGAKQIVVTNGKVVTESSSVVTSIAAQPADGKKVTVDVSKKVAEVVVETQYEANTTVIGTTAVTESKTIVNALNEAKKYSKDATKVPSGFVIDKTNQTITIKDAVALMYYGYVLDAKQALASDTNDWNSIWWTAANVKAKLDSDIDLEGAILDSGLNIFAASLDGNGHTIKNVKIVDNTSKILVEDKNTGTSYYKRNVGLFADIAKLSNIVLDNVVVTASQEGVEYANVGIAVGYSNGSFNNVTIKNSSVTGGKYTGGVVGDAYASITNCKLTDCTISGQYKVGGVAGFICTSKTDVTTSINNNTLSNVTIVAENVMTGKTAIIGKIVGHINTDLDTGKFECIGNTFSGTTVATELVALKSDGVTVKYNND